MKRICSSPSNIHLEKIVNSTPPPDREAAIYRALVDYIFYCAEPEDGEPLS